MKDTSLHYMLRSGKNSKFLYYCGSVLRNLKPDAWCRKQLEAVLEEGARRYDEAYVKDRVDYYCKLQQPTRLCSEAPCLGSFHRKNHPSVYYFDSHELTRYFSPTLRWQYLFGDVRDIPDTPTIVKSRSITQDNANAVLLKLNRVRHYIYLDDKTPFAEKDDRAIFRGQVGTRENRIRFVEMYARHPRVDAANTLAKGGLMADNPDGKDTAPRLSLYDHLKYRYILCLEGNDVATNLKWVMSSHSLAVMPPPTCETWFMEGRLKADYHYVSIRPDFADLIEKMDYYSSHPKEAQQIIDNANRWVSQFRDTARERYIGLRVLQKYLTLCN
ncbi:MAG: lipopolysaccharide biosynthesis protein [Bacteroidales bacterium]|nr:lipopolysaccharide biosynthesis protein [Bacteroidales bacterium]